MGRFFILKEQEFPELNIIKKLKKCDTF